ncbi:MAG: Ku protein [Methanomicrobiales archaeon]|nr:Ku protein [Methanomicrobiales archaeon]MDD1647387.1 Ku protein [Methanomicrobiales archaeon]
MAVRGDPHAAPEGEGGKTGLQHAVWTGSISLGLVRVPVKMVTMTRDRGIHFRMIHRECGTPIHYRQFCEEGKEVPDEEIVYGYEIGRNSYVTLEKSEIREARPETSDTIRLEAFVRKEEADPHYFLRTYLLIPDGAPDAYALLRAVMKNEGQAAVGRISMFQKEYPILVHVYRNVLAATTLRYADEILDPSKAPALQKLPEPSDKEVELATFILQKMAGQFDLTIFEDAYQKRLEQVISARKEGRILKLEPREAAPEKRDLMQALRQTAEAMGH